MEMKMGKTGIDNQMNIDNGLELGLENTMSDKLISDLKVLNSKMKDIANC